MWDGLGKLRQQGLGDGEELRGLGEGCERVTEGEALLCSPDGSLRGSFWGRCDGARGQEHVARSLVPITGTLCMEVTVKIPPSRSQALVCHP